jgi:hypothetical protein
VLSAWLATLHKDQFIERQPGTTAQPQDWNRTVLSYLLGHFGLGVTYLRGKRGGKLLWPSRYEAWSVLCACTHSRLAP